jgi:hypothetical protein
MQRENKQKVERVGDGVGEQSVWGGFWRAVCMTMCKTLSNVVVKPRFVTANIGIGMF